METLEFGQSETGLLNDGLAETPYVGATLKMENPRGVIVEVPYIHRSETNQFTNVSEWFRNGTPPENLLLETPTGPVGLYGITRRRESIRHGVSLGQLAPRETLLGRCEAPLDEPLVLSEVHSQIDGLREWTDLDSVDVDTETDDNNLVTSLTAKVNSAETEFWSQGRATMRFKTNWRTSWPDGGFHIADTAVLVTRFPTPQPFGEHLAEQRKVLSLLTLISGVPIHFREHKVSAESIVRRSMGGTLLSQPKVVLISADTVRDHARPLPSTSELQRFSVSFNQVGSAGMERWALNYEKWKRFILPAVGVLERKEAFVEDVIVSLSMSIESAGQLIGKRDGEKETYSREGKGSPTTATYVYRCLQLLGVDWGDLAASQVGLARAVSNAYNDIKHFDRGEFPDLDVTYAISVVTRCIVRLVTLHIVDDSGALLESFLKDKILVHHLGLYSINGVSFGEDGKVVRSLDA